MRSYPKQGKAPTNLAGVQCWQPDEITGPVTRLLTLEDAIQSIQTQQGGGFLSSLFAKSASVVALQPDGSNFSHMEFPAIEDLQANPAETSGSMEPGETKHACQMWSPSDFSSSDLVEMVMETKGPSKEELAKAQQMLDDAEIQAQQMIQRTRTQADEIIRQAESQADITLQDARSTAAAVTDQAHAEGLVRANAEIAELLHTANSIVEEVQAWRESQFAQGEMMMLRMVIEIAQSIFGDGLPLDPDALGQAFSRALSEAKTLGDLRIYAHPEDIAALGTHWSQLQSSLSGQKIELVASDIIKRGGCFVEGQYGSVDSRVETQFRIVRDTLMSTYPVSETSGA